MPLVMLTEHLIDLLKTLKETAGDDEGNRGVFLFTARGPFGEDPGETDLLAGIATNSVLFSHYYLPFDGGDMKPTFWPVDAIDALVATFAPRAKEAEEHVLRVTQHPDGEIEIAEYDDPSQGVRLAFRSLPVDSFPLEGAKRLLRGEVAKTDRVAQNESPIEDGDSEMWDAAGLGKALAMAKKRKSRLVVTKSITNAVCTLRMDKIENWKAAILPVTPGEAIMLSDGANAIDVYLDVEIETDNVTV